MKRRAGGKKAALGHEEAVGCDAEAGVMVEAAPATALIVPETNFLLQFLVVAFDPPALHGVADQRGTADGSGQRREPGCG